MISCTRLLAEILTGAKNLQSSKTCCPEGIALDIQQIAITRDQDIGVSGKATLKNHVVLRVSANDEPLFWIADVCFGYEGSNPSHKAFHLVPGDFLGRFKLNGNLTVLAE